MINVTESLQPIQDSRSVRTRYGGGSTRAVLDRFVGDESFNQRQWLVGPREYFLRRIFSLACSWALCGDFLSFVNVWLMGGALVVFGLGRVSAATNRSHSYSALDGNRRQKIFTL